MNFVAVGTAGVGVLLQGCDSVTVSEVKQVPKAFIIDRTPEELIREQKLLAEKFFDDHEMKTIHILVDIIIPKDEVSGSATDAGVPDFIEFIVKDMPRYQTPLRGGLKWLDIQCMKRYNIDFASATAAQQLEMVDEIAYPEKAKPELQQGVAFFNTLGSSCGLLMMC